MNTPALSFVCEEKPRSILIALVNSHDDLCGMSLSKRVDCTYPHTVKVLFVLEHLGCVVFEKSGRSKFVFLTDKGRAVAEAFNFIRGAL